MNKQFVPFELSVKLKELGFDEPCFGGWDNNRKWNYHPDSDIEVDAPLWQQAFDWFREKHGFDLLWKPMSFAGVTQYYDIEIHHPKYVWDKPPKVTGKTYEEVRLACLKKLIELTK